MNKHIIEDLESQIEEKNLIIAGLEYEVDTLNYTISDLENDIEDLEFQLDELGKVVKIKDEIGDLKANLERGESE